MHKRGKSVKRNLNHEIGNFGGSWQEAIERAERLLRENKVRAAKLRAAVRVFQEKLASGEPWPGSGSGGYRETSS